MIADLIGFPVSGEFLGIRSERNLGVAHIREVNHVAQDDVNVQRDLGHSGMWNVVTGIELAQQGSRLEQSYNRIVGEMQCGVLIGGGQQRSRVEAGRRFLGVGATQRCREIGGNNAAIPDAILRGSRQ